MTTIGPGRADGSAEAWVRGEAVDDGVHGRIELGPAELDSAEGQSETRLGRPRLVLGDERLYGLGRVFWTADKIFHAACGPKNLTETLTHFRTWATTTTP